MNDHPTLTRSLRELRRTVNTHCRLVENLDLNVDVPTADAEPACEHRIVLRQALGEAIEVLESTRSSFKSKQLEVLRKKLIRVLVEHG